MKTLLSIFLAGLIALFVVESIYAEECSFRKTTWGMSISQVKSSEALEVAEEDETMLVYKTSVIDKDVYVVYIFVDNQLVRTRYVLAESHSNKTDFITDYNEFKEILTKKYGKPKQDESIWKNDLYKDDYSDWGTALSVGHLVLLSNWETQDTEISNVLLGENFEITCGVEYISKNLRQLEKKAQEKEALDAF